MISAFINGANGVLYFPIMVILLVGCGLYFTIRLKFLQVSLSGEYISLLKEQPKNGGVSSFQALMVSTASRVGTGNVVGVANAICLGGEGAVFWMWIIALIGGASAFVESTLAQIYKRKSKGTRSVGGPSYYIETALGARWLGVFFAFLLILTYGVGFNMLASFNLQDSFKVYSFYKENFTCWIIGGILALFAGYCILGGGKRIIKFTSTLVPIMGVMYVLMSLVMIIWNIKGMPDVFRRIFIDAFNFKALLGGVAGSSLVQGIKRGLYSNEAGIGSAPNAAASADVSHPVKQGVVQMLSVFIDTLVICSATAFMALSSKVLPSKEAAGALYIQEALGSVFGRNFGNIFITLSLILFAFTTLIGNLYYVDSCFVYLHKKEPSRVFKSFYRLLAALLIMAGAGMKMSFVWDLSDFFMALMCLVNVPVILILGGRAVRALDDYRAQKRNGKEPHFIAREAGIKEETDYWK